MQVWLQCTTIVKQPSIAVIHNNYMHVIYIFTISLLHLGVIVRSFFYLLYWVNNSHSEDNDLKLGPNIDILLPAIGGAIIEV